MLKTHRGHISVSDLTVAEDLSCLHVYSALQVDGYCVVLF